MEKRQLVGRDIGLGGIWADEPVIHGYTFEDGIKDGTLMKLRRAQNIVFLSTTTLVEMCGVKECVAGIDRAIFAIQKKMSRGFVLEAGHYEAVRVRTLAIPAKPAFQGQGARLEDGTMDWELWPRDAVAEVPSEEIDAWVGVDGNPFGEGLVLTIMLPEER